ncbi:MAG: DUF58 domain-containing protein [Myxococcales bacterium]|nr:DUF58 domain-containing protein [Myxococcales bacterium]
MKKALVETRDETREVLRQVRRIEIATRRAVNDQLAGRYHSVFKGQGMAFSEVRPYMPGDDIRHIDWNVSARHAEEGLFVKQFTEERELTVMLVVDLSASGAFATRGEVKRRRLAKCAAMVAFSASTNNDRVGLVAFTDHVELHLPPRKGRGHMLRVIREVLEATPTSRGTNIEAALAHLNQVQRRRSVVFVMSDFLDDNFDRPMRLALARHDVVAMRVIDPAERILPDLGLVEMVDAETGATQLVDSSSPYVRAAYTEHRTIALHQTKRRLTDLGCDVVDISTDEDMVKPLVSFFRVRARRQRSGR